MRQRRRLLPLIMRLLHLSFIDIYETHLRCIPNFQLLVCYHMSSVYLKRRVLYSSFSYFYPLVFSSIMRYFATVVHTKASEKGSNIFFLLFAGLHPKIMETTLWRGFVGRWTGWVWSPPLLQLPRRKLLRVSSFYYRSRSQAAKTYLERKFESFADSSREDLIKDAILAVRETLQGETLKSSLCTVSVLGVGEPFHFLDQETIQKVIDTFEKVANEEEGEGVAEPAAPAEEGGDGTGDQDVAPMET